ncbi:bifunctional riboflavin kinase/FAD synthetase [Nesterenkonia sp. MY13]|uniref:Riboflavin biosynthesis protein n=1 Tax=Nesterenkonia sedimenti TaxID=1463632 RepID=A0A7X8TLQ0_9MICC|nr:bifunctional riboflavin kinase/FAD synthetase [Nesterenkonia sedimenti]NLS11090.1 bifunctional riboflavin kinase/FAD synthetase [Nesterenkonia sedimenti]
MQIFNGLEEIPKDFGATALTIGNFDGVHLGHQHVLTRLLEAARQREVAAVAITFDPHPAFIHRPEAVPDLLTGTGEKLARLEAAGLDAVLVLNYTEELAGLTAEEFVATYFVEALKPAAVVVGHDVRLGRNNHGDFTTLEELGAKHGFEVIGVDDYEIPAPDLPEVGGQSLSPRCSSTAIRTALTHGDVAAAAHMLGQPHTVTGEVVHGEARGRELGFPTANLSQDAEGMVPADGVYAGWVTVPEGKGGVVHRWPAAISVGSNPTFDGVARVVEAHVIDRSDERIEDFDLYGRHIRVEFVERLRGMVAYEGVEKLIAQMNQDVEQTRHILAEAPAGLERPLP